jgi:hypothetical protein
VHFLQSCMALFQICRSLRLSPSCLPTCSSIVDRHAFSYLRPRITQSVGAFLDLNLHVLLALGVFTICLESEEHREQSEFGSAEAYSGRDDCILSFMHKMTSLLASDASTLFIHCADNHSSNYFCGYYHRHAPTSSSIPRKTTVTIREVVEKTT